MSGIPRGQRVVKPAAERREEILTAALRLFHEQGFDATTVQDIAEAADVAAGTVYLYFSSKDEILGGLHERFHEGMLRSLERVGADLLEGLTAGTVPYPAAIDAWIDAVAGYALDHRAETTVICRHLPDLHEPLEEERRFIAFVAEVLEAAKATGQVDVADPEMAAHLLVPMLRDPLVHAIVYGYPPDLDRLVTEAKDLFRKALQPKG